MANQPKKYKKFVATAATATLVASAIVPVASAASLSDIAGNTHEEAINALVDAKVISGYPDGTFKPNKTLTRSDVVKLLGKYLETEGYAPAADYATSPAFNDLKAGSNQELLKYASIVKEAGVFAGSNGNLLAGDKITRENMAITLVRMINTLKDVSLEEYVAAQDFKGDVKDLNVAKAEARTAIAVLDFYDITNPAVSNFNPKGDTTRGQFATFLHKTINADFAGASATTGKVTAINNTTVEVTFGKEIDDIKALKFAIEGLTVENAVVKQTDKKTAVITTSAQEAGKEYTVAEGENKIGKFTGVAAVIPTKIDVNTKSVQGVIGKEVTLSATVTVPEGQSKENVPVTFNIVSDRADLNSKIEVVAYTNKDGVATHSYTRYYSYNDNVSAYATQKSSVISQGKVYWAEKIQLAVTELTTGNTLTNETKKAYKVNGAPNTTYYINFEESVGITPDKIKKVKVITSTSAIETTPYELVTGAINVAEVRTNANGEGTFTIYGSNDSVTPVVYQTPTSATNKAYNALYLQTKAATVKFEKVDTLQVKVAAQGVQGSAEVKAGLNPVGSAYDAANIGGREYVATVTDKNGKLAPEGTRAYVSLAYVGTVYFAEKDSTFTAVNDTNKGQFLVTVGKNGEVKFRVAGTGDKTYVQPTVYLETGSKAGLDDNDVKDKGELTYFGAPIVVAAELVAKDKLGRTVTTAPTSDYVTFVYQSVDQNGFAYVPTNTTASNQQITSWKPVIVNGIVTWEPVITTVPGTVLPSVYTLVFDVTSSFGGVDVTDATGGALVAVGGQNLGNTKTYHIQSNPVTGQAMIRVNSELTNTVSVNVSGANNILPIKSASVEFVNSAVVADLYSGIVESVDTVKGTLKFAGKNPVSLLGANTVFTKGNELIAGPDAFMQLLLASPGAVSVTRTVKDGVTSFNIYNISTTGVKPVDTAASTVSKTALQAAVDAEVLAALVEANYTPATWATYAAALTNAKAVLANVTADQTTVNNAVTALTAAKDALVVAAPTADAILTATSVAANDIAAALNLYKTDVTGTVATAEVTSVELTFTNAAGVTHKETVAVTDQRFTFSNVLDLGKATSVSFNAVTKTIE